jgi:hypothetical protein
MKNPAHHSDKNQSAVKSKRPEEAQQAVPGRDSTPTLNPQLLPKLPQQGAGHIRRAAVLQMQRRQGNGFVQRYLARRGGEGVQRLPEIQAQEDQQGSPTSIGDGSAKVSAAGGIVEADGAMIKLNAPVVETGGILRTSTLIADNIVASNYTPGAGNVM